MRTYMVVSHAWLSKGMVSSLKMIAGEKAEVDWICGYVDGNEDLEGEIRNRLLKIGPGREIVLFTDLFGGSANNAVLAAVNGREDIHVVAGVNLALLLSVVTATKEEPLEAVIRRGIREARDGIVYCKELKDDGREWEDF